jgi:hypothetical protein
MLGLNISSRGEIPIGELQATGVRRVRFVALPDYHATSYIKGLARVGIGTRLVFARESWDGAYRTWGRALAEYHCRYGRLVDSIQIGNEPDHRSVSSWTQHPEELNLLLFLARDIWADHWIVGPGLVSGDPNWARLIDLSQVDALAFHPYAKEPHSPELVALIQGYADYGKPLVVSEYAALTWGMAQYLGAHSLIDEAYAFAYHEFDGLGLRGRPEHLEEFKEAVRQTG